MSEEAIQPKISAWRKYLGEPRHAITLVTAITALVTAATSLVKACDKSVEHASYDSLSKSIEELQGDNNKLHDKLDSFTVDASSVLVVTPPPVFADAGALETSTKGVSVSKVETAKLVHIAKTAVPVPTGSHIERFTPPPSWDGITRKAETAY